ncbi:MAG: ATP-binding protein [Proteobacteria bacterium]|nr:ATP-binding protein [Pseudomonadota bacterium]
MWRVLLVGFVLMVGVGAALGAGYWISKDAEGDWRRAAAQEAMRQSQTLDFALRQSRSSIRGFASLFQGSIQVRKAEFLEASTVIQAGDAALRFHGYAFVNRIKGDDREEFESKQGARLSIPGSGGRIAPDVSEHFAVLLTSQVEDGLFTMNSDLAAVEAMRHAVSLAYHTPGTVVLGPGFSLDGIQTCAVIAFATGNGDRRGVLVGLLNITDFFKDLRSGAKNGLALRVAYFDPSDTLLAHPQLVIGEAVPEPEAVETHFISIAQGQSSWGLYWDVLPHFRGGPKVTGGRIVAFAGSIVAILVAALLALFVYQNTVISRIVRLRTRELRVARDEAEQASRAKTDFLANMSHELRTPLNAIIGFSEILESETFGPLGEARYRQYATDIHSSGHHLLGMINDILDVSKAEVGQIVLHETEIDLPTLIKEAMTFVADSAGRNGLTLTSQVPSDLPQLRADELRCRQILINLLSNAVKFTRTDGQVTVGARLGGDGRIVVFVSDAGVGIAPEDIKMALTEFGQIGNPHTRQDEGTGLGLPLAKRLAELHGAELKIESAIGQGTTIGVVFPRERTFFAAAAE